MENGNRKRNSKNETRNSEENMTLPGLAKFGTGNSKIEIRNRNWEEKRKLEAGGGDVFEDQLFVHVEHLLSIEVDTCKSHPQ